MTDAELFAEFLENREVFAALRPWWRQSFIVSIEHSPPHWSDAEPFAVHIEKWAVAEEQKHEPNPSVGRVWKADGRGRTLAEAARRAAEQAEKEFRKHKA